MSKGQDNTVNNSCCGKTACCTPDEKPAKIKEKKGEANE